MKPPTSHKEAVNRLRAEYEGDIANGTVVPFVYPVATIGIGVGLLFFLIPPTSRFHNRFTRYAVFIFIASWHAYIVAYCKGLNPSTGFGVGAMSTFGTMWAAVLLVFHDAKASFKRIEMREQVMEESSGSVTENYEISERITEGHKQASHHMPRTTYFWQAYPSSFNKRRLYWIVDVWINFRLIGWDKEVSSMPSYPVRIQSQLDPSRKKEVTLHDVSKTKAGLGRYDLTSHLLRHNLLVFLKGYLILDILLTLTRHDPYFWGDVQAPPPAGLPHFVKAHPEFYVKGYRLYTGMIFIWLGLRTILVLAPLCFVGLFGKKWLGIWGEPWLYPDHYGSYKNVLENGIAGWWAGWWHQSFTFAFYSASNWLNDCLNIQRRSNIGKFVTLLTSFFLSGLIHASGSQTQQGQTDPLRGSMMFFMVQPCGIIAERLWRQAAHRSGLSAHYPKWVVYVTNFLWINLWFWLTAPLIVDDLGKGGLWLTELIPFSPSRLLGLGPPDDGAFRWNGPLARWHTGNHWFSSGVAL